MKSDKDYDWAECHYADKEDKYEPLHDCTSTKYDEIYREDPMQRQLRELKKQKEELIQQKINTPLSEIDDPDYINYRNHVNQAMEQSQDDEYLRSQFTVYKNQDQQDRCYHTLQSAKQNQPVQTLMSNDFEYNEKFRKGMLEPSVSDFSKRNPISSATVSKNDIPNTNQVQQSNSINHTKGNATPTLTSAPTQETTSNVNLMGETNNMLQVNNVDNILAQQIQQQAPQISPDVFMQQQAQIAAQQMTQGGPQLTLTMGGGGMSGFINVLVIAAITGFLCGVGILVTMLIIG